MGNICDRNKGMEDKGSKIVEDWANTWIRTYKEVTGATNVNDGQWSTVNKNLTCDDGFEFSIQAGPSMYSIPQLIADHYDAVEIGFPTDDEPLLKEYAEDPEDPRGTVYGWVPVTRVNEIIEKHGGICEKQFLVNKLKDDRTNSSRTWRNRI